MTAAAYDVYKNKGMPNFYLDDRTMVATVRNLEIHLVNLPIMYFGLLKEAQSLILGLTDGIAMAVDLSSHLHDDLSNNEGGYNMFYQEKDWFIKEGNRLYEYYVGKAHGEFIQEVNEDRPIFYPGYVKSFMDKADELCKLLLILYHISSGQPGRGTEVICLTYQNLGGMASMRNLYWVLKKVAFISCYNKVNFNI
jgi:hypothetical protein